MPPEEVLLVDTLEVLRGFEKAGLQRDEADVLTRHVTKLIVSTTNRFAGRFASYAALEKSNNRHDSEMVAFKNEMMKMQELQINTIQRDIEGLKNELSKIRTEIKHEVDKVVSGQRLDLNLEKGRLRDELVATSNSIQLMDSKLHQEVNGIRTTIEANKNELIKYSIGTLASLSALGLGLLRILS